jgi:hypothetical protein
MVVVPFVAFRSAKAAFLSLSERRHFSKLNHCRHDAEQRMNLRDDGIVRNHGTAFRIRKQQLRSR